MSDRPLRVLHCIQNLNYGGMERVLSDLVHHIDPDRFEPHVLTFQYRGRYSEGLDRFAELHDGPTQGRLSLLWPRGLIHTLRSIKPDVIHAHSGVWYKTALANRFSGVARFIFTEHGRVGPETLASRFLHGAAARITDQVIAVSEATAVQISKAAGIPFRRIRIIHNGIDTTGFSPGPSKLRHNLDIPPDTILIGTVGRLEPVKDYPNLLRALRLVLDQIGETQPVHLVVAGDGSMRGELESLRAGLALNGHTTFLGWWDDPEGLLRALDLFVLSSISEGMSISLLEAMSTGCCPLVTRVGGNAEVLGPELAHRLVESRDPKSLANGILSSLSDPGSRRRDAELARRRVEASFNLRKMVEAYTQIYAGP